VASGEEVVRCSVLAGNSKLETQQLKSLSNPDSIHFHNHELSAMMVPHGVSQQIAQKPGHQWPGNLGMIQNLKRNDALKTFWRIGDDVREVTVQRHQDCVQFLGLGDNHAVHGLDGQTVFQPDNFVPGLTQRVDDKIGNALVSEESERH
jgi:hypothetical protein